MKNLLLIVVLLTAWTRVAEASSSHHRVHHRSKHWHHASPGRWHHHRHHARKKRVVYHAPPPKPHHFADQNSPIHYSEFSYRHARYSVVIANLADPRVTEDTVLSTPLTNVWKLLGQQSGTCAAITGTFFDPNGGRPVGDVVVNGALRATGYRGSAIAADQDGELHLFDTTYGQKMDWTGYRWALRGAIRLIRDGYSDPNPVGQRFHDHQIWMPAARTGVGITRSGKLILMATQNLVSLHQFAHAMLEMGAVNAINLDGGSSTCLYYRGQMVIQPGRRLSNLLVLQTK